MALVDCHQWNCQVYDELTTVDDYDYLPAITQRNKVVPRCTFEAGTETLKLALSTCAARQGVHPPIGTGCNRAVQSAIDIGSGIHVSAQKEACFCS